MAKTGGKVRKSTHSLTRVDLTRHYRNIRFTDQLQIGRVHLILLRFRIFQEPRSAQLG